MAQSGVKPLEVAWLRKALRNLDEEAAYIAQDNPPAAQQIVARIMHAVDLLTGQPGLGRPGRVPGTRELPVPKTRYLIPYRVRGRRIEILRVFHTSRKPPSQW
ncbi:MAG TPA: type II toxin-antitoxin system RelE/ParE family toxin [Burkholderiales bacterium]|nr:type II toxin-antitoxin system RelE/ParE family toxin [Burkholderiales bacterium]